MAMNKKNTLLIEKVKVHTNAQYALKSQLEGNKIDPKSFGKVVEEICLEFGFRILLEIPSPLIEKKTCAKQTKQAGIGTAIAILCPDKNGCSLLFAICKSKRSKIVIFDEKQIPQSIVELAWSYATVLSLLPRVPCINKTQKTA